MSVASLEGIRKDVASKTTVLERYAVAAYHYSMLNRDIDSLPKTTETDALKDKVLAFGNEVMDPARTAAVANVGEPRVKHLETLLDGAVLVFDKPSLDYLLDPANYRDSENESKGPSPKEESIERYDTMIVSNIKGSSMDEEKYKKIIALAITNGIDFAVPPPPSSTLEQTVPTTAPISRPTSSCKILVSAAEKAILKKLADDPNYVGSDINTIENILKKITVTFIMVRHGISLSNLKKEKEKEKGVLIHSHTFISDPRLTDAGIAKAYNRGAFLKEKLDADFPGCTPIVWSSLMLRAQMTAALMLNPDTVTVIPYASELSTVVRMATDTPEPFEKQTKRLVNILNDIPRNSFLKGQDQKIACINSLDVDKRTLYSPFPLSGRERNTKPDVGSFLEFVKDEYFKMPGMSLDDAEVIPKIHLVIFTHGLFIEAVVKATGGKEISKENRQNYAAFKFTLNLLDDTIIYNGPYNYTGKTVMADYEMSDTIDAAIECTGTLTGKEMEDACK